MAIKLSSIADSRKEGIKIVGYGPSGAGKTHLINTLPNPIIINVENKLASIKDMSVPVINVANGKDAIEAIRFVCTSDEMKNYESIAIDSMTELSDFIFADAFAKNKGNAFGKANGDTEAEITNIYKQLKGLTDKNVYMICKYDEIQDADGVVMNRPRMATKKLTLDIPHKFDIVFAVLEMKIKGEYFRVLQCKNRGKWFAADVYGVLEEIEEPNIANIISKVKGGN